MAIERNEKLLNGAGLAKYTELLKLHLDGVTTTIAGDISDIQGDITNINNTINNIIGDATSSGDSLGELEDRIETIESQINDTEAEDGESGILERLDNLESDVDDINDELYSITTTISELGNTYKTLQDSVALTAPAGSYISGITQNDEGVVGISTTAFPDASSSTEGLVQMASGATTNEVYDKNQIDGLISGVSGDVDGLTSTYKQLQTAVANPTASGSSYSFISGITQDVQGKITPVAATLPTASASSPGLVQMASGATTAVVYDKKQVDDAIADAVSSFITATVAAADASGLPDVQSPQENIVYLVPNGSGSTPNYYIEYMYINNGSAETPSYSWEVVGNTELTIETLSDNEITNIFNTAFIDLD